MTEQHPLPAKQRHPLPDNLPKKIAPDARWSSEMQELVFFHSTTAANCQLEQVIEQWEEVINSNKTDIQVIREFDKRLKAMRPQEDN